MAMLESTGKEKKMIFSHPAYFVVSSKFIRSVYDQGWQDAKNKASTNISGLIEANCTPLWDFLMILRSLQGLVTEEDKKEAEC